MMDNNNFTAFVFGFIAGFVFLFIILAVGGKMPMAVYDRAVRDCKEGKVRMEITTDTIYRAP